MRSSDLRKIGIVLEAHRLRTSKNGTTRREPVNAETYWRQETHTVAILCQSLQAKAEYLPAELIALADAGQPLVIPDGDSRLEISARALKRARNWLYEQGYAPDPPTPGRRARLSPLAAPEADGLDL